MTTANMVIGILLIIMALFLVVSVLMQNGKDHRLSGSIAGGAETFFGKTKGKSLDAKFAKATTIITILFVILVLVLYIIQPEVDPQTLVGDVANDAAVTDIVENEDETATTDETVAADETAEEGENVAEGEVAVDDNAVAEDEAPAVDAE